MLLLSSNEEDITEGTKNDIEWQECVIYPGRVLFIGHTAFMCAALQGLIGSLWVPEHDWCFEGTQ